ncbi:MAG: SDR family oxidoreductase [Pseudoruegeria sp.]
MIRPTMLITGASSGIGAALAELAAQNGWDIGVNYRADKAGAETVAKKIHSAGGRVTLLQADIADAEQVKRMFRECTDTLGSIASLINNAGVTAPGQRVEEMSVNRLQDIFQVNTLGSIYCAQEAVRHMAKRYGGTGGTIVNVSSVAARLGSAGEYVDYAAAKAAIDTFTIGLAQENADEGIRVNAVRPGITDTPIHARGGAPGRAERLKDRIPMKRPGTPKEIAEAILWFASEQSSYATGSILDIAGGR